MPEHIKEELKNMAKELKKKWECPICYDFIADEQLLITNCGHYYCVPCLESWKHIYNNNDTANGNGSVVFVIVNTR